uniref:Uncharacterized protein n=1 Tax=Arundo donax TaxID=35708 RepID=A0A0A9B5A3_ARUDO
MGEHRVPRNCLSIMNMMGGASEQWSQRQLSLACSAASYMKTGQQCC